MKNFGEALLTLTKRTKCSLRDVEQMENSTGKLKKNKTVNERYLCLNAVLALRTLSSKNFPSPTDWQTKLEDATAVVILAPQTEFSDAEVNTLLNFWRAGKSLFIALEPEGPSLEPILSELNVRFDPTPLAHGSIYMPTSTRALPIHQRNLVTNKFSTHASVTTLSRYNQVMQLVFANAGSLEKGDGDTKVTTIIKSLEDTWQDSNRNLQHDAAESKSLWALGVAIEQESNELSSKTMVFSDASWITDDYLGKGFKAGQQTIQPHAIMLSDTLFWLTDQQDSSGTVNNEQDIKIQHSKEGQGWIFFGSSILFPFFILAIGRIRISNRTRGGAQ